MSKHDNQPEALRLADALDIDNFGASTTQLERRAAIELRRLHEDLCEAHKEIGAQARKGTELHKRIDALEKALTPLTDEQIEDEWERFTGHSIFGGNRTEGRAMYLSPDEVTDFARAIEAAIKEQS